MATSDLERRALLAGLAACGLAGPAAAQSAGQVLEDLARQTLQKRLAPQSPATNALGLPTGVSAGEADGGIREALTKGAGAAILRLGKLDGYWGDDRVRLPLPSPLGDIQRTLRALGMSGALDDLHMKINRAAETAAPGTRTIFADAIRDFSIGDVVAVVHGGDTAGTTLLQEKTQPKLVELYAPIMLTAVDRSGAGAAFDRAQVRYGSRIRQLGGFVDLPAATGQSTGQSTGQPTIQATATGSGDRTGLKARFVSYATGKALDGLFAYIGEEERQIRRDPLKRTSDLLKRVFGG
jgi:hypothetical protein